MLHVPIQKSCLSTAQSTEPTDPGPETQELLGQTTCSLLQLRCGIIRDREPIETETSSISVNMSQRMEDLQVTEDLQCEYGLQLNHGIHKRTADWGYHIWAQWQGSYLHRFKDTSIQHFWELLNLLFHKSGNLVVKITGVISIICHTIQKCWMYFHIRAQKEKMCFLLYLYYDHCSV